VLKTVFLTIVAGAGLIEPCLAEKRALTTPEKKIVMNIYGASLKDPGSAQYRWAGLAIDPLVKGDEMGFCFQVNARNSYGAYTGFKTIAGKVKRRNGAIIAYSYAAGGSDDAIMAETAQEICRIIGYRF
jgi:hypothetical protein